MVLKKKRTLPIDRVYISQSVCIINLQRTNNSKTPGLHRPRAPYPYTFIHQEGGLKHTPSPPLTSPTHAHSAPNACPAPVTSTTLLGDFNHVRRCGMALRVGMRSSTWNMRFVTRMCRVLGLEGRHENEQSNRVMDGKHFGPCSRLATSCGEGEGMREL